MMLPARCLVTGLVLACVAAPALAGPVLLLPEYGPTPTLTYRFDHPHLALDLDAEVLLGSHELTVSLPAGQRLAVWAALPLVKWGLDGIPAPQDEAAFGNASLGVQFQDMGADGRSRLQFGVQLPTAQDMAADLALVGVLSRPFTWQTFLPDILTVHGRYQRAIEATPEASLLLMAGPEVLFPTGGQEGDPTVHLRYGVGVQVRTGRVISTVEFGGFWETDGDGDGFSGNSAHVIAAGVTLRGRVVSPGLFYQVPTDEIFEDLLDGVLGLRVTLTPGS